VTPLGNEPVNFWLVLQCLNRATACPLIHYRQGTKMV